MSKNEFLKELQKINPYAEFIEQDSLSNISDWISTGSLVLNNLVSGDFNKGIPAGRLIVLAGKCVSGDTKIIIKENNVIKTIDIIELMKKI